MRIRGSIAVLAGCCALAACTAAPSFKPVTSVTPPPVGRPQPPTSVQAAVSRFAFTPYGSLGQANDDGLAPNESSNALNRACMADAGYADLSGSQFDVVTIGGLADLGRSPFGPWGYLGVATAAQEGFQPGSGGWVIDGAGITAQYAIAGQLQQLPTAALAASNKCAGIVADFDAAQRSGSLAGIGTLSSAIQTDLARDPSVRRATKQWSACMARNGYNLTDPKTAILEALGFGPGGAFRPSPGGNARPADKQAQIAMAVTDADCTQSTDLAGIYFAVLAGYEQQIVDQNQQALNAAVTEYRTAYRAELGKIPAQLRARPKPNPKAS